FSRPNSSSTAMVSSTMSRESAPRSSKEVSMVMLSASTPNCSDSRPAIFSKIMFIYSCRIRRPTAALHLHYANSASLERLSIGNSNFFLCIGRQAHIFDILHQIIDHAGGGKGPCLTDGVFDGVVVGGA